MTELETRDAIVIGGNAAALSIAYLLGSYGYRTTLVERAPFLGGNDASWRNENGRIFDYGVHALDHHRSEFVTRLFERAVDGRFRRLPKVRRLLLRGHLIPYNAPPEEWPADLRALMKPGEIVDDLAGAPPTREALGAIYGPAFADFVFDEVLASYPAEHAQLGYGVDESELLVNIYPWFFPRVERTTRDTNPHDRYQNRVRREGGEHVIYPEEGGFGGFMDGLADKARALGVEVEVGADDLHVDYDADAMRIREVRANGRRLASDRVYWCGPPKALMQMLGRPAFDATPEQFALGSLQFERPVDCDALEILGGDPAHHIKRASFPGKLQGGPDDLVQIEFHFPKGDARFGQDEAWWFESWTESLRALGVTRPDNEAVGFDLKLFPIHYNAYGIEGRPSPELELPELPPDTNLKPVATTYRRVNLNTRLPMYLELLARDLARN